MKFWKEFKEFITKGNVLDLAVAVIMGASFTAIVNAFINNLLMPIIGIVLGKVNFADLKYVISEATATGPENAVYYGLFIQALVNFLLVALIVFIIVKVASKFKKKQEDIPIVPSNEEKILTEIRDILKSQK